jgi:signal transduction histidine kinase
LEPDQEQRQVSPRKKAELAIETLNPTPDKIEVRVIDTGIGIESETIGKIFDAFEQGQSDITRRFGGLGLGLTISKTLIDAHGGHIRVQSSGKITARLLRSS